MSNCRRLKSGHRSRRVRLFMLLLVLLSTSILTAAPGNAAQPPGPDGGPTSPMIDMPPTGPPGISTAIDSVFARAKERRIVVNNAWYVADKNAVVVLLPPPGSGDLSGFQDDVAAISTTSQGFTVAIKKVSRTYDESKTTQARVDSDKAYLAKLGITTTGSGINADGDTVIVDVLDAANLENIRSVLTARFGHGVDVQNVSGRAEAAASRQSDYAPWFGGDRINVPAGTCTSGFAVHKPGYGHYMLTAGHCFSGTGQSVYAHFAPPMGSAYFGYSSQWENTYGQPSDYALVTGQYAPYVWNGGPNGTAFLPVIAANTSAYEVTDQVCFDGSYSGQVCRGYVVRTNVTVDLDNGNRTTGLTETVHTDPGYMCQHGDSGGPVYDGYLSGGLRARGIFVFLYGVSNPANVCYYLPWSALSSRLGSTNGNLQIDVP